MASTHSLCAFFVFLLISFISPSNAKYLQPRALALPNDLQTNWTYAGCYTDSEANRTLAADYYGDGSAMTDESCVAFCNNNGYIYAGTEYSSQCYCDNSIGGAGTNASDSDCNMACSGNSTEPCGGSNRLTVFWSGKTPGTAAVSSTTSSTPSSTSLPTGWSYKGCYIDGVNGRDFANQQNDNSALTIQSCINTCIVLGYSIAAMEYSVQCFCDDYVRNGGALASSDSNCAMACGGQSNEICGGPNLLSVYSNETTLQIYHPPAPQNASLPGDWQYAGCLLDNAVNRTLPYQLILPENNTATNCLSQCSTFGYNAGGMEYGDECYCGDVQNVIDIGTTLQPESDCSMPCSGNASEICGAGDRLSYYTWGGSPLYVWEFPTGNDAGLYEFLIGGVVVPLLTTASTNGKVTFLEKYGTGPPNSTGAYELDLAQLNNFTAAWRTMHVKTDIFCSGSVILPDRVGRQINVGGWANDATYGVRLYWPDGSPGQPSTNDWQENVSELSLQVGRWYPSVMVMANGSLLVVGGEEGSNGAPVPSLEILPKIGPVLYCDYLNRTNPYNLYPFLSVLPSGGVLILYYNEARILDEVTLETSRTLPNIPGAVNDFLGGRTYPFEGTAMLLPQYAPYTDPLTVIVCGGSVPGPEIALDNCASIQPEVAGANWTIERMPSKRVETCMVALPDGTYLILNGGQQGRAGFGTSSNPNLNALLYDPSKPVNQRISMMANTTIARLYHSEAILLMDGRVLVSGSDPDDTRYPEEYRVEVFQPPYLLAGATPPVFSINTTDWAYGQTVPFTITSSSGGSLRVSLLGAVSSTHGNSMGQRTIFPAFSCTGSSCTVTAPPNAHVCPPGWFMMFVLDGPMPSFATWVRVGGDPADLGSWPDYADFTVPGPGAVEVWKSECGAFIC